MPENEPAKTEQAALDDAEIKLLLGQAEVEKAILRKSVRLLLERNGALQEELAALKKECGGRGAIPDEEAV